MHDHHTHLDVRTLCDAEAAVAARGGDREAFGELVRRHYGGVYAVALGRVRDPASADDVAQETFISAWTHIDQLRVPRLFLPWLLRIARNLSLNWTRSASFRTRLAESYRKETEMPTDAPHESAVPSERHEDLLAALADVAPRIREVLILFYLEDRSIRDTARALGITESAAKKRLQRGRESLRATLESKWAGDLRAGTPGVTDSTQRERVLGGLAAGPALPELARTAAHLGPAQWLTAEGISQAGRFGWTTLKPALAGGSAITGKHAAVGVGIALLLALAYIAFQTQSPTGESGTSESAGVENPFVTAAAPESTDAPDPDNASSTEPDPLFTDDSASPIETSNEPEAGEDSEGMASETERPTDEDNEQGGDIRIDGIVVDEWEEPVSGAEVFVFENNRPSGEDLPASSLALAQELSGLQSTHSGGNGAFTFSVPLETHSLLLYALKDEFQGTAFGGIDNGTQSGEVRIVILTGIPLSGRVVTQSGKGIPGASVISVAHVAARRATGGRSRFALTDPDGYFVLAFDEPGFAALRVVTATHGEQLFHPVEIGNPDPVDLVVEDPAIVYGVVTRTDGSPAADIRVTAESEIGMDGVSTAVRVTGSQFAVATNAVGEYRFDALTPGVAHEITPRSADFRADLAPGTEVGPLVSGEELRHDIEISDVIEVRGYLLDTEGRPVEGARLRARSESDPEVFATAGVEPDGYFALSLPGDPGTYQFVPAYTHVPYEHAEERAPHMVRNIDLHDAEPNEVELTMDPTYTIAFRITDGEGRPLAGAGISPQWHPQPNSSYGFGELGKTDANGLHSWNGYAPLGSYSMWIRHEGYLPRETAHYEGAPGDVFGDEHFKLYKAGTVRGSITVNGEALTDARLFISTYVDGERYTRLAVPVAPDGFFTAGNSLPATAIEFEIAIDFNNHVPSTPPPWQSRPMVLEPGTPLDLGVIEFTSAEPAPEPTP